VRFILVNLSMPAGTIALGFLERDLLHIALHLREEQVERMPGRRATATEET